MSGPGARLGAVLVLIEHEAGRPSAASLAAVSVAGGLAGTLGVSLAALALGEGAAATTAALGEQGVAVVHVAYDEPGAAGRPFDTPALPGQVLARLLSAGAPRAVLAAATARGHETLAYAAALTGLPLAAACTEVRPAADDPHAGGPGDGSAAGSLAVTRLRWGGSVLEDALLEGSTVLLTVAEGAVASPPAATPATPRLETLAGEASEPDRRVRLVERVAPDGGGISLAEARVVVGGGRGVGGPEGFGPLEELAGLLGGAVGVSRVVTSAGWRPHSEQVGQTGTRIAPDLYIACGISGAIQHIVGCRGAKAILAINTDRDAPIMARATHAVIGDLRTVVPAVIAEVRRARGEYS